MKTDTIKCHWCRKPATMTDYREVDGITSKIYTCHECFGLSTAYLIERKYGKPADRRIHKLKEKNKALAHDLKRYQKAYNILMDYFDSISDDEKPKVDRKLNRLGL